MTLEYTYSFLVHVVSNPGGYAIEIDKATELGRATLRRDQESGVRVVFSLLLSECYDSFLTILPKPS